ncbi:MAG: hypothetical protein DMG70_09030 [Acidobacteria bacterium]|nr:MAG: hypothetical protein DMG70_09030 [Acidobacteriota bacterium]PYY07170.1 MAG: hypothetical protein DMG69_20550 [Acidobacteriota bacterium]
MGSGAERSSDSAFWKELYEAALFEFDSQQLPERIAVAEKAVTERRRELTENGGDRQEEQEALDDALFGLSALRKIAESRRPIQSQSSQAERRLDDLKTGT